MMIQAKHLDKRSPVPLFYQLQEHIRTLIAEGQLKHGDVLPTETELADQFDVSRATIREALRGLVERGLVEKRRGVGSFVTNIKIDEVLPGLVSFSNEMRARGFSVQSLVLDVARIIPPSRILSVLRLSPDTEVVMVKRLRSVNHKPFLISTSFLPVGVTIEDDFSGSIYDLLEHTYGYRIMEGQTSIEAGLADEHEAGLLDAVTGSAVLRITWLALTEENLPVEYSENTYRSDRYRYVVHLHR